MNTSGWLQLALYMVVLLLLAKPLGAYMAAVYEGRASRAQRIGGSLERLIYRGAGVDPRARWTGSTTRWRCSGSTWSARWSSTRCSGCSSGCRSIRRPWPR